MRLTTTIENDDLTLEERTFLVNFLEAEQFLCEGDPEQIKSRDAYHYYTGRLSAINTCKNLERFSDITAKLNELQTQIEREKVKSVQPDSEKGVLTRVYHGIESFEEFDIDTYQELRGMYWELGHIFMLLITRSKRNYTDFLSDDII